MADRAQEHETNKGFNIKTFVIAVVVGMLAILALLFVFVLARGKKDIPKANQPNPNSRLVRPASLSQLS